MFTYLLNYTFTVRKITRLRSDSKDHGLGGLIFLVFTYSIKVTIIYKGPTFHGD